MQELRPGKILTVSIAAYNVEEYLDDAVESCIPAIESLDIIIVNDGSKDGTLNIAKRWENKYPNSIRVVDKSNGGYGSTINASIPLARGNYFRYLDADDWFDASTLPNYIHLLIACSEDAILTPYVRVYEDNSKPDIRDCVSYLACGVHSVESLKLENPIAGCAITYKTEILQKYDFRMTQECFYTDTEFAYIPMSHVNTLYVSHIPIYQYRIGRGGQSVSLEGIRKHHSDHVRVCMHLLNQLSTYKGDVEKYLQCCLLRECCLVFRFLCLSGPSENVKNELKAFDEFVKKKCPRIFKQMEKKSKLVLLLRRTRFLGWRFACNYVQRRE